KDLTENTVPSIVGVQVAYSLIQNVTGGVTVPSEENVTEEGVADAERMTVDERRKCLKRMQARYLGASREERGRLLDELVVLTGLHRKSVVRLLAGASLERQPRRRQRGREYGAAVDDALRVIWETLDYVCAER